MPDVSAQTEQRWPSLGYLAKATAVILLVFFAFVVVAELRSVLTVIFIGFFLALGMEPMVSAMVRRGLKRPIAVLILCIGILFVLSGIFVVLLRPAIQQTTEFVEQLPEITDNVIARLDEWGIEFDSSSITPALAGGVKEIPNLLAASLGSITLILGGVATALFSAFTITVLTIYFMLALPRLRAYASRILGDDPEKTAVMDDAIGCVGGYVSGQLTLCALAGITSALLLTLFGVPYAAVIGLLVAVLDAIPQIGAIIGALIGTLIGLSGGLEPALIALVVLLAYQQLENYVIGPRVFAKSVDLSALAVFVSLLVGASAAGVVGAITALPIAAAAKVILQYVLRERAPALVAGHVRTPKLAEKPIKETPGTGSQSKSERRTKPKRS